MTHDMDITTTNDTAAEKIQKAIQYDHRLRLSQTDAVILVEALERPAKINTKLRAAASRYDSKAQ
uniref:DUF1778 domain-containing protein n=1 Tax=uncultured Thiotrichaceae bacterium TaxID=298394 RepID=A0A6S6UGS4_9GAMM|nr:MAG: Unknown protein [uncultured Thiotrichaceae bacterium]